MPAKHFAQLCHALHVGPITGGWPDRFGKSLHAWVSGKNKTKQITTLSLFSGAGGLDIGFHDAGFHVTDLVEIEKRFTETLAGNSGPFGYLGECAIHCLDIRHFFPKQRKEIDFIIGGPPCQSFSAAGRRASGVRGINDSRGTLFEEYVRLLRTLKPKGFLFENVYGITGANGGKAWTDIQKAFKSAGYTIQSRILDAADYGVPQHRERLFIVGIRQGAFKFPRPTHGPDSPDKRPHYTAGKATEGAPLQADEQITSGIGGRYGDLLSEIPPGLNYSFFTSNMGHPRPVFAWRSKFSDFLYKASPERCVRTLKAQGGQYTGPFHWESRRFTIGELKRLQTFPDEYLVTGGRGAAVHQLGNSVPPQLARVLALSVREQVFGLEVPALLECLEAHEELGFRTRKRELTAFYHAQSKAKLAKDPTSRATIARRHTYTTTISDTFRLTSIGKNIDQFTVEFTPDRNKWALAVHPQRMLSNERTGFQIEIKPTVAWDIPVPKIVLIGGILTDKAYTTAWKALEAELASLRMKADLVQLSGYYQYRPAIQAKLTVYGRSTSPTWTALSKVCAGIGVRETLPAGRIADLWGMTEAEVLETARHLRSIGYEVRNRHTNPEIPRNYFLIPYSFPTLSPLSVQLRKSLTKDSTWQKAAQTTTAFAAR
jgi:DNA (cytosine-5)-methyltransferase 1